jgi:primary-amine oxidase
VLIITDDDSQTYPAGRHVPQTSGDPSQGLPAWIEANPNESVANTDIVLWHTFGIIHFPSPEDFPVMPAEPMSLLLRPRNFFVKNPALDIPPSYSSCPSGKGTVDSRDVASKTAFSGKGKCGC